MSGGCRYRLRTLLVIVPLLAAISGVYGPRILRYAADWIARRETVIPGTWNWDLETETLGGGPSADLWWEHVSDTHRFLVAKNGAGIAVVPDQGFSEIDLDYLRSKVEYGERVEGSDDKNLLAPGAIIAVRTAEGNYGKLKVSRYFSLHDFDFPGSNVLRPAWKRFAKTNIDRGNYHLDFDWVLYRTDANTE